MQATHVASKTTRGWGRRKPQLKRDRGGLLARCGCRAFLDCQQLKYPFMAKRASRGSCRVDCVGLRAALSRAAQQHHPQLVAKARRIGRAARCRWAV